MLNVSSKTLNRRSKTLNRGSTSMNGDFNRVKEHFIL